MNAKAEHKRPDCGWLEALQSQVQSLQFGTVQVTVHDGRVVQIETTEKVRFDKPVRTDVATPI